MDTYALFVDLRKAYDSVDPRALMLVLQRMGVPASLVELLRHRNRIRTTQATINGARSQPFAMRRGVGQGDIMSPLLFNLFIESLQRYLRIVVPGLHVGPGIPMNMPCLLYADELQSHVRPPWMCKLR